MVSGQLEKHVTSMSFGFEPAIWSRDTGQQILCFDRRQSIIACMSNIKEVHGKPRLHVSVNLLYLEYGRHVARLRRRRCRAYAPTSNTASHETHEKINSRVSFSSLIWYGAPLLSRTKLETKEKFLQKFQYNSNAKLARTGSKGLSLHTI